MRRQQITPNLVQLTRLGFVNAYLVREDDGFTLIDTTVGGGAGTIIGAAQTAGGQIARIALTHGHSDHVGSLDALHARLGADVPVLLSALDARILAGEWPVAGTKRGGWPKVTTTTAALHAGERVGSLEVIATPGHTPGHVSFIDTRDGSLIAGDAVTSFGGLAVPSHFNWRFPLSTPATWDRDEAIRSAQKLLALEPKLIVAGHGPAVRDPAAALAQAIVKAKAHVTTDSSPQPERSA